MTTANKHTPPVADAQRLGSEIREVRKARGLTLNQLSQQISCSSAYLSRIELGSARISAALLHEISIALQVEAEWFFPNICGSGPLEQSHVVRAENRRPLSGMYTRTVEELGFQDELLSSSLSGQCYLLLSRFPAQLGAKSKHLEGYVFEGEQHGLVLSGEIKLQLGDESIILCAGDSFSYPSMIAHRFSNNKDEEATMVWAMSPVRISW